jgi:biopolymer transport protein ExbD
MAFSSAGRSGPLADINVTPLVDVMLVLLIIFIVTAPMLSRPINVQLPQATDRVVDRPEPPPPIELRLDASSQLSWDGQPMAIGDLQSRLQAQASEHSGNQPELRISTDPSAEYDGMAKILAAAEATGMQRIAFVQ